MPALWDRARELLAAIESGTLEATETQKRNLIDLIDGFQEYTRADTETKRVMTGLMLERQIYLPKLWLLEKVGVQNNWGHPLLQKTKKILFEESKDFTVADFMVSRN